MLNQSSFVKFFEVLKYSDSETEKTFNFFGKHRDK